MSSKNNNTQIIDENKIQKQIETIKSNIEKLKAIDTSIVINVDLDEKYTEEANEIQKKVDELNKLQIELAVDNGELTETEKKLKEFDSNIKYLEIEKILLEVELDDNNDTLEYQLQNKIDRLEEEIFEQSQKKIIVGIQTYIDENSIEKLFTSSAKYVSEFGTAILKLVNTDIDASLSSLKYDYEGDLITLKNNYDKQDELYETHLTNLTTSKKTYEDNISDLEDEKDELETEKQNAMTDQEYEALQQKIDDKEAQIAAEQKLYDQASTDYDQTLKDQEEADDQYANDKLEIEQNYQTAKAEMEIEAAKNTKAVGIFNATITMLQSILQATLTGLQAGFPLALGFIPTFTALAATTGGLQIAAIAKQPLPTLPQFATGGYIGAEYAGNYKSLGLDAPNNTDNTLAWLSTGERVLTPDQNSVYEKMLLSNYTNNSSKTDIENTYNVSVNVAKTNSSSKAIAKAVVKAIGGKV